MDPVSALGIAAAVVQFAQLGGKAVVKCWDKYCELQQNEGSIWNQDNPKKKEEIECQLKESVESLNIFVSEAQLPSIEAIASQPPTPAQQQLANATSECSKILSKLNDIAARFIEKPSNEPDTKARRSHGLFSRSKKQEPDNQPEVTRQNIEEVRKQCEFVRGQAIDSILMCLWENSKQTKAWEVHFGTQLNNSINLLENINTQTTSASATDDDNYLTSAAPRGLHNDTPVDMTKFREAIIPLVDPTGPNSMPDLGKEMADALRSGVGKTQGISNELVEVLWRKDWEIDLSIPGVSATDALPNLDTSMVAHATSTSVRFEVIDTREAAVPQTFGNTYRWILDAHPPTQGGKPLWESFPKWLIDNSRPIYWITGKPGSGKSTMMKFLLQQPLIREHLSRELGTLHLVVVRYYAWNAGKDLQKSFAGLRKTLISQALELHPELTSKLSPRRWTLCQILRSTSYLPDWEPWEIEETFNALLSQCGKTIKLVLFIDGLDEFDTSPKDVIEEVRKITSLCPIGLKICVASRPWNAFNDEYGYGPSLEMHLATYKDMVAFVTGSFEGNRAFAEHHAINPQAASELVSNVVTRANGVFQWVSLVIPLLLDLLTDGESPTKSVDIQHVLEDLPSELETLYDAIWDRITPENLHNASFMMQIMRAAGEPLSWLSMWAVEDLKLASARVGSASALDAMSSETIEQFRWDSHAKKSAKATLKRKLVGRTKGILELNLEGDGFVDFIHRTARDWAAGPKTWELICKASKESFDPHLYLLQADILTFSYRNRAWPIYSQLRDAIMSCFWHASKVETTPENDQSVIKCLISLEDKCRALGGDRPRENKTCWAPDQFHANNTFVGLASQFSILPYVKFALQGDNARRYQKPAKGTLGLLENAIFGPLYYNPPVVPQGVQHPIPSRRRLDTIECLLEHGIYQSKVQTWNGVRDLRDELQSAFAMDPEFDYYTAVLKCLDKVGRLGQMRLTLTSASGRLRSKLGI